MKTVQEFLSEEQLQEKLLLINQGKKYGQIVILAGGAGSGKGFASSNFMNIQDFKVRDVDEMKLQFLKLQKAKGKFPELEGLNLKNPRDVVKLHMFVAKMGTKGKTLDNLMKGMSNPETLPNILFDVTFKNTKQMDKVIPELIAQGYKRENIHLVWVLTDYSVAVKANKSRARVVADDILLQTHEGAAKTMWNIVNKGNVPKYIDGGIYVILNNRENTIFHTDKSGKIIKSSGKGDMVIKDFKYLTFKKPKKAPFSDDKIRKQLFSWITGNIPKTKFTTDIWK